MLPEHFGNLRILMENRRETIFAVLWLIGCGVCFRAGLELFGRRYLGSGVFCALGFCSMFTAVLFDYENYGIKSLKDLPWNPIFLIGFGCTAIAVLIYFFS